MSIAFDGMNILTILSLPNDENGKLFHLFLNLCHQYFNFQYINISPQFIPKYFLCFGATVNGIVFLISFSDNSLLVYRNATDFCMLTFVSCKFTEFIYYNYSQWNLGVFYIQDHIVYKQG